MIFLHPQMKYVCLHIQHAISQGPKNKPNYIMHFFFLFLQRGYIVFKYKCGSAPRYLASLPPGADPFTLSDLQIIPCDQYGVALPLMKQH